MNGIAQRVKAVLDMNGIGGTFAQRVKAVLDLTNDRLDHMVTVAGLDPAADLRYGNWRGFDLSGADLRGFDFTGADLTGARFDNAFIAGAIFRNAICDARSLQKAADFEEFLTQLVNEQVVIQRSLVTQEVPNFKDDPHLRDKLALLKDHYLFSKFPLEYIERLAACMVQKSVPRATSIFAEGDQGTCLFAICQGAVQISVRTGFKLIGKGEMFLDFELLSNPPGKAEVYGRSGAAHAVAVTDCKLFVIEQRDLDKPEFLKRMWASLSRTLRRTIEAGNLMFLDLPGRLAKAMLLLSESDSRAGERKVAVTQEDLGNIIRMSRESTNRQLRIWEQEQWIRLERGEIFILCAEALEPIAGSPGLLAKALLVLSFSDRRAPEQKVTQTQEDLSNIIGMSRESIDRQLRIWEEQGWVRLEPGGIVILSATALERIAESGTQGG